MTMAEYIEKAKILDAIAINHGKRDDKEEQTALEIWDRIKKIPAADVAEVRHGEWKIGTVHPHNHEIASFVCTACRGLNGKDSNYCPNCGADMRGGKNE